MNQMHHETVFLPLLSGSVVKLHLWYHPRSFFLLQFTHSATAVAAVFARQPHRGAPSSGAAPGAPVFSLLACIVPRPAAALVDGGCSAGRRRLRVLGRSYKPTVHAEGRRDGRSCCREANQSAKLVVSRDGGRGVDEEGEDGAAGGQQRRHVRVCRSRSATGLAKAPRPGVCGAAPRVLLLHDPQAQGLVDVQSRQHVGQR